MKMKKFTYFANHGDENGKGCWTVCYGKPDGDEIIIGVEDRKKDAIECAKRLNSILKSVTAEIPEAKDYDEAMKSHKKIVREVDMILNGKGGAAKQASLIDLLGQIKGLKQDWTIAIQMCAALRIQRNRTMEHNKKLIKEYSDLFAMASSLNDINSKNESSLNIFISKLKTKKP